MKATPELEVRLGELNEAQAQAVNYLDGPLLVLAGPGTGKTQLLALRAAKIMIDREVGPENILCLTFSREGAENMRSRLTNLIGEEAAKITISTYHEFGSYIIRNFPEYFRERDLRDATDELYTHKVLSEIRSSLPYTDALSYMEEGSIKTLIRDARLALLSPDDLREIAVANQTQIDFINPKISKLLPPRMPSGLAKVREYYEEFQSILGQAPEVELPEGFTSLAGLYLAQLTDAFAEAEAIGKSNPLNDFKSDVITKDGDGKYILKAANSNPRMVALASVYEQYIARLAADGLYDYDDMILEAVRALETHPELKRDLAERYQYILLDEYQDTNRAQARIVELLTNSAPENRPDVMAVGDDDQAIYAFQGAQSSNLKDFYDRYNGTALITLTNNYRSSPEIIEFAKNLSAKIESSVTKAFDLMDKPLHAAGKNAKKPAVIERIDFKSPVSENVWVAAKIRELLDSGVPACEIAVLGREHAELVALSAQLAPSVPISYAKRENILTDSQVLASLLLTSELVVAIANDSSEADVLFPRVLSLDIFSLKPSDIWRVSWAANDQHASWSQTAIDMKSPVAAIVEQLLDLALQSQTKTMEIMIDEIVKKFFAGNMTYELISHLTVLKKRLSTYVKKDEPVDLQNLINFVRDHREINAFIANTSPYAADPNAITLMTAHSAKGLEWDYVLIINAVNDKWNKTGSKAGSHLPTNTDHIHPSGDSDDDRLRLLFVTLTRARHTLYITRSTGDFDAKPKRAISFFDEREEKSADGRDIIRSHTLPEDYSEVCPDSADAQPPTTEALLNNWLSQHLPPHSDKLADLIADRVSRLKLTPTHIDGFTDLEYADDYGLYGPQSFFVNSILAFPRSQSINAIFGTCIHSIIEFIQKEELATGQLPTIKDVQATFDRNNARFTELSTNERRKNSEHAALIIPDILKQREQLYPTATDQIELEQSFTRDNIILDGVPITGRIDRIEKDPKSKTITVTDFKTGKASNGKDAKTHRYERQIYFYKLLVENSSRYTGYTVTKGRIVYVDTEKNGEIKVTEISSFSPQKLIQIKQLIKAIHQHILTGDYPDISEYGHKLSDIINFESSLLSGTK